MAAHSVLYYHTMKTMLIRLQIHKSINKYVL